MRTIERSTAFKRDYKQASKRQYRKSLDQVLVPVLTALIHDKLLDQKYKDHNLSGNWAGYRECHIKPDLLLIYQKTPENSLKLVRLGSHSALFG